MKAFTRLLFIAFAGHCFCDLVYVANYNDQTISVIDSSTQSVVQTLPSSLFSDGDAPYGLAIAPNGTLYATSYYSATPSYITAIDTTASPPSSTFINLGLPYTNQVTISPDGNYAYVSVSYSSLGEIRVVEVSTNTNVYQVVVGAFPCGIAFTPNGHYAYVANTNDSQTPFVSVLDTSNPASPSSYATITGGSLSEPHAVVVTPDGLYAYVSNETTVSVIEVSTHTVVHVISDASFATPRGMAVTPDGSKIYVANSNGRSTVSIIETGTNTVSGTITVGSDPWQIALTTDGYAYVTNSNDGTVSVIDLSSNTVAHTITVGNSPMGIASTTGSLSTVLRSVGGVHTPFTRGY